MGLADVLKDRIENPKVTQGSNRCGMARCFEALPKKDSQALREAIEARGHDGLYLIQHAEIYRLLKEEPKIVESGIRPSARSVANHRHGRCGCDT